MVEMQRAFPLGAETANTPASLYIPAKQAPCLRMSCASLWGPTLHSSMAAPSAPTRQVGFVFSCAEWVLLSV